MFVGGRYCDWGIRKSQQITPMLAKRTGRPVRCVNSRTDMYDFNLCQRYVHMKVGFKSNGLITAIDDFSIADGGVRGSLHFRQYDGPDLWPLFHHQVPERQTEHGGCGQQHAE